VVRRSKVVRRAALGSVVAVVPASHAFAGADFGSQTANPQSGVYLTPDDNNWVVSGWSLNTPVTVSNVAYAVVTTYGSTDMNPTWIPYAANCNATDLCVIDDNSGDTGWWGRTSCVYGTVSGTDPNAICSQTTLVQLNTYVGTYYPSGAGSSRYNTCHEIGHTIGLRHRTGVLNSGGGQSCMRTAAELAPGGTTIPATDYIIQDEKDLINAHYKPH
jgi:hypothetical protein